VGVTDLYVDEAELEVLQRAIDALHDYTSDLDDRVVHETRTFTNTPSYDRFLERSRALHRMLAEAKPPDCLAVTEEQLRILRSAVCHARLRAATAYDDARAKVPDPAVVADLRKPVQDLEGLMRRPWFMVERPERLPQVSDFLNLELALATTQALRPTERTYDEKFHILQSPNMLGADLTYYRRVAELRGNGSALALAYLDLDWFKSYNDLLGEVRVDVEVLPPIMRVFETFVAERGYAYRFGGDEYVLLLANTTLEEACRALTLLRARLAHLRFEGIAHPVTASVGMVLVEPDTHLTNHEVLHRAQEAKRRAKEAGRDCVWTYRDWRFERPVPG
jgi:diguanylate cyclase (GGDEF)-like protein